VAATLLLWITSPSGAGAQSAIDPSNRPLPLPGQVNGDLPASELINVAPDCVVHRSAAPSLGRLLASARHHGVTVTTSECYRPVSEQARQAQAWTARGNSACAAAGTRTAAGVFRGTSIHGWGRAADFGFGGGSFGSAGYQYLKSAAGAYGWNHPGWAEPGGGPCPEAWHWEWVGDGGETRAAPVRADVVGLVPTANDQGYATVTGLGGLSIAGNAVDRGSAGSLPLNWLIVASSTTPDRNGYWMVGADGGVFSFGNARFFGSTGAMRLNQQVIGMAPTPSGNGYWLVAADGGVFSFGDARFFGSTGATKLNKPVVGMAASPSGNGYWLVASDGGIFAYGDAAFVGSTGATKLNQPVVSMAATATGNGYWLVASDGGVFGFGAAPFLGSAGAAPPAQPVVSITRTTTGAGYWMTVANGVVLPFGDAKAY